MLLDRATTAPKSEADFPPLVRRAVTSAARWHAGQQRECDGAPFIEHPLEVARLLLDAGSPGPVVAAGVLHDVLEHSDVRGADLRARFGDEVAELVLAVSDDEALPGYRRRKRALRKQVMAATDDALLIFAADKISKVRELAAQAERDPDRYGPDSCDGAVCEKLEHYRASVVILALLAGHHPLVRQLIVELAHYDRGPAGDQNRSTSSVDHPKSRDASPRPVSGS